LIEDWPRNDGQEVRSLLVEPSKVGQISSIPSVRVRAQLKLRVSIRKLTNVKSRLLVLQNRGILSTLRSRLEHEFPPSPVI
jgi:hypothetical protein